MAAITPLPPLPGMIIKPQDFKKVMPTFQQMEDRMARLRVQAFIVTILELFEASSEIGQLEIEDDGMEVFSAFSNVTDTDGDDPYGAGGVGLEKAIGDATGFARDINLNPIHLRPFLETSPLQRESLESQLRLAYEQALEDSLRDNKGGAWETFWTAVRPRA